MKRGSKTLGPFTAKKVVQLIKAKKLKSSDEVSLSEEGPWDRLSDVHKEIRNGTYALPTPVATPEKVPPNVRTCPDCVGSVSKRASSCPHCGAPCGAIEDDDFSSPLVSEGYDTDYDAPPQRRKKTSKRRQLNAGNSRDDGAEIPVASTYDDFLQLQQQMEDDDLDELEEFDDEEKNAKNGRLTVLLLVLVTIPTLWFLSAGIGRSWRADAAAADFVHHMQRMEDARDFAKIDEIGEDLEEAAAVLEKEVGQMSDTQQRQFIDEWRDEFLAIGLDIESSF
jgi:hypothetical protein